jgi:serine/threonine-protein kinase
VSHAEQASGLIGSVVQGRYRILSKLGEGGMGAVYVAEHVLVGKRCALKTLHPDLTRNAEAVKRFYREARTAAAVGDEHIVDVSDVGHLDDGSPYIVMELLEGMDLGQLVRTQGPLEITRAARITVQCCRALARAHDRGIIHRDIKPDNIFLTRLRDGRDFVKLLDFGVSKVQQAAARVDSVSGLTSTNSRIGTPHYMAPEQIDEGSVGRRTDVYALGAALFEMLTGRVPFDAESYPRLLVRILQEPAPPLDQFRPDAPAELVALVARALSKDPRQRFADMGEMAAALAPLAGEADGRPPAAGAAAPLSAPEPAARRPDPRGEDLAPVSVPMSRAPRWVAITLGVTALAASGLWVGLSEDAASPAAAADHLVLPEVAARTQDEDSPKAPSSTAAVELPPAHSPSEPLASDGPGAPAVRTQGAGASRAPPEEPAASRAGAQPRARHTPARASVQRSPVREPEEKLRPEPSLKLEPKPKLRPEPKPKPKTEPMAEASDRATATPESQPVPNPYRVGDVIELTPVPEPKPEPKSVAAADSTRSVEVVNTRRATVKVRIDCGEWDNDNRVPAGARGTIEVPARMCRVECTGLGGPECPVSLRAGATSLVIR